MYGLPHNKFRNIIFDDRGMPWTIRLGLGWTTLIALFSLGAAFLPLGVYLSYWVRTRNGHSVAFWCYLAFLGIVILALLPITSPNLLVQGIYTFIGWGGFALLIIAPLTLRAELIALYRRSWNVELEISLWLTIFFSSVYLNYTLLDLPIPAADANHLTYENQEIS